MNFPKIDIASLPDLDTLTGAFGSLSDLATAHTDDSIIAIMVFVYEAIPPVS